MTEKNWSNGLNNPDSMQDTALATTPDVGSDAGLVSARDGDAHIDPVAAVAVTYADTICVRDACLCLHVQRAARVLARRFDEAFRPLGLTNGQVSLLMALNQPRPPTIGAVATVLASDRTTLTAALKPLERRGLVQQAPDVLDRRSRRLHLTPEGAILLGRALPVWRAEHAALEGELAARDAPAAALRSGLACIGQSQDC